MRILVSIIVLIITFSAFSQKQVVFYDPLFTEVVSNVQVFNLDKKFIGLSNESGRLVLTDADFPVEVRRAGYVVITIKVYQDTIELSPKFQEIAGVDIKPVNKM